MPAWLLGPVSYRSWLSAFVGPGELNKLRSKHGAAHRLTDWRRNFFHPSSSRVDDPQQTNHSETRGGSEPAACVKPRTSRGSHSEATKQKIAASLRGVRRSKLHSQRIAAARLGQRYKSVDAKDAATMVEKRHQPRSEETKAKIAAALKEASLKRGPLHNERIAKAHLGLRAHAGTRYKMHVAKLGRQLTESHKAAIREGVLRQVNEPRKPNRRSKGTQKAAKSQGQVDESLVRERAVYQLQQLRSDITRFMATYEAEHGFKPTLEQLQHEEPVMWQLLARYVSLQDYVRGLPTARGHR